MKRKIKISEKDHFINVLDENIFQGCKIARLQKSFKIHSKQFVYETLTGWGLDPEKTYSFKGEYFEERKMIIFCLNQYENIDYDRYDWT